MMATDNGLFSLDGTMDPVPPSSTDVSGMIGSIVGTPNLENGARLYQQACVACHGEDGEAGHVGPPITPGLPIGQVVRIIADGRNEMPGFTGTLSSFQARDIAGYVTGELRPVEE